MQGTGGGRTDTHKPRGAGPVVWNCWMYVTKHSEYSASLSGCTVTGSGSLPHAIVGARKCKSLRKGYDGMGPLPFLAPHSVGVDGWESQKQLTEMLDFSQKMPAAVLLIAKRRVSLLRTGHSSIQTKNSGRHVGAQ